MAWGLRLSLFLVAVISTANAQSGAEPVVVLDDWWNVGYAKNSCVSAIQWQKENSALVAQFGCDAVTSCPEMTPVAEACGADPVGNLYNFDDELVTQFAANSHCNGVQLVKFAGPDINGKNPPGANAILDQHWSLSLDYQPGARRQSWEMSESKTFGVNRGEGEPKEIAETVCSIVTQRGAKLLN
jgi:hypothetical protein